MKATLFAHDLAIFTPCKTVSFRERVLEFNHRQAWVWTRTNDSEGNSQELLMKEILYLLGFNTVQMWLRNNHILNQLRRHYRNDFIQSITLLQPSGSHFEQQLVMTFVQFHRIRISKPFLSLTRYFLVSWALRTEDKKWFYTDS